MMRIDLGTGIGSDVGFSTALSTAWATMKEDRLRGPSQSGAENSMPPKEFARSWSFHWLRDSAGESFRPSSNSHQLEHFGQPLVFVIRTINAYPGRVPKTVLMAAEMRTTSSRSILPPGLRIFLTFSSVLDIEGVACRTLDAITRSN